MHPEHFEIRFLRESLGLRNFLRHLRTLSAAGGSLRNDPIGAPQAGLEKKQG